MRSIILFCFLVIIGLKSISQSIGKERIAIMDFQILANDLDLAQFKWMSFGFSETLSDAFSRINNFSVIERTQLERILKEQEFQRKSTVDTTSVVKIGRLLGVEKILLGSCQIATGYLLVNMRIVNVETGQVYPLKELPIITPIDSVLYMQKRICSEILRQFNFANQGEDVKQIENVTSASTKSIKAYEYLNRGILFYNNGQYIEAVQMYNIALGYDKKYGKAYYRRGLTNYALNQFENAADDFNNSSNYLKNDTIYILMSNAYFRQGDLKKAYEYLKKAERLSPANENIKQSLLSFYNLQSNETKNRKISDSAAKFETIFEFNNGKAKVLSNGKYGFIDTLNQVVIPIIFDEIHDFRYGFAAVKIRSKWGFMNDVGEVVIKPYFTAVEDFNQFGLAGVSIKNKWGAINLYGKQIIPIQFNNPPFIFWDTLVEVSKSKLFSDLHGVYDITGKIILPPIYEDIDNSTLYSRYTFEYYPYIHASLNGKWGVVNRKNEIIVPFIYKDQNSIRKFKNGYAAVKVNERWGIVNNLGLEIIKPIFDRINDKNSEYFEAKLRGKWGLVDIKDSTKMPFLYDNLEHIKDGFWAAKNGRFWGIVDSNNKFICDFVYDAMGSEANGDHNSIILYNDTNLLKVRVVKNGKYFWINENCKCIYNCE